MKSYKCISLVAAFCSFSVVLHAHNAHGHDGGPKPKQDSSTLSREKASDGHGWPGQGPGAPSDGPNPKELYIVQLLNHFNYLDHRTWSQRYLLQDSYWNGSGPLFFYTGNEGPIESFVNNSGFILTLAKQFNALVVFAEHRYYGKSLPLGQDSLSLPAIGYLSVGQALADYAVLIQVLKTQYTGIFKVIAFGGSYGGMLTAWMRFKYPNLVDGGLAASAPIYNTEGIIPETAFFKKVTDVFAEVDPKCPEYVRDGLKEMFYWAQFGSKGYAMLYSTMQLCDFNWPWNDDDYIYHLADWARNAFTSLAMMNYPYATNFLAPLPANPVRVACDILVNSTSDKLAALAQAAGVFYNGTGQLSCFNYSKEFMECADPTGCGTGPAAQAWDYQACTEMRHMFVSNNVTDMFAPSMYNITDHCERKWGMSNTVRADWMKTEYWGKRISSSSNVIFSNGNLDPWSVGGVMWNVSDSLLSVVIKDGAHHMDLRAPDPRDPPSVTQARELETTIIKDWIG